MPKHSRGATASSCTPLPLQRPTKPLRPTSFTDGECVPDRWSSQPHRSENESTDGHRPLRQVPALHREESRCVPDRRHSLPPKKRSTMSHLMERARLHPPSSARPLRKGSARKPDTDHHGGRQTKVGALRKRRAPLQETVWSLTSPPKRFARHLMPTSCKCLRRNTRKTPAGVPRHTPAK